MQRVIGAASGSGAPPPDDARGLLVAAGVVLLVAIGGWLVGLVARLLVTALFHNRLEALARAIGYKQIQQALRLKISLSRIIGYGLHIVVAVLVYLFFASLYFPSATAALVAAGAAVLPPLLIALVILLVGLSLSQMLADLVFTAARAAQRADAALLSTIVRLGLILLTVCAALIELGVATLFITALLVVTLAGIALALGLAIGIGGADYVRNLLASRTVRTQIKPGQRIQIDGITGIVVECGPSTTLVASDDGKRTILPNRFVAEKTIVLG